MEAFDGPSRQFLFELLQTPSPTGFEIEGQRRWSAHVRKHVDRIENDAYGNTWATVGPVDAPARLMIEAHADEIGLMISHIADDGFLYVTRMGGSDRAIMRGRRIRILGADGDVFGVIGNTAIHLRDTKDDKVPEWHELYIDVGASSRSEVADMGIRIGQAAVLDEPARMLGEHRIVARALDNRIGGYIVARVLEVLAREEDTLAATILGVNAVQEEIGGNGARMVTYRLRPSVALVLDVTHATDSPGISHERHGRVTLGGGPTISHGTANHPLVVQRLLDVAAAAGIDVQHEASSRSTGTDTDDVFVSRSGVPSALVSIPMRYMHSPVEMVDLRDVEKCVRLVADFARSLGADETFHARITATD